MKEVKVGGSSKSNGITILALNVDRFRGELEILSQAGFKVFKMPYEWQTRVFYAYKDRDKKLEFKSPLVNSLIYTDRIRLRKYLSELLKKIILKKDIDCVITANIFYNQDFDWSAVASKLGLPYIAFHRENLVVNDHMYSVNIEYAKLLKEIGFHGSSIVFHNKIMKSVYDKYSGVNQSAIHALGSLRMDQYIHNIKSNKNKINNSRITLFSFPSTTAIEGIHRNNFSWHRLHDSVHTSFVELAIENPEIEFVIKHKGVGWMETKTLLIGLNAFDIVNLKIHGELSDAQELILESDVVTGFCSTALLEAGISGKPIVYPLFEEAHDKRYSDFLCFSDALNMFDIATSKDEYKELLIKKMNNPVILETVMKFRELQFERHVSSLNADTLKKYSELIIREVENSAPII
jgi:hypothetical protein